MRSVALALVVGCLLVGCTSATEPGARQPSDPASTPSPAVDEYVTVPEPPKAWRTEVWRDVQLEVPRGWALGYAPLTGRGDVMSCGTGPLEGSGPPGRPYVGRPGYGSDVCLVESLEDVGLDRPGVWFDSPLPTGDVLAKSGLHQVTVDTGGTRTTVASKDDAELRRLLDSVELVGQDANGCPARPRPSNAMGSEGPGQPTYLSVCLYESNGAGELVREWTERQSRAAAEGLLAAVEDRVGGACPARCLPPCPPVDQVVLLRVHGEDVYGDEVPRDLVVSLGRCPTLQVKPDDSTLRLTGALVEPWASAGVATYVRESSGHPGLTRHFRPLWG